MTMDARRAAITAVITSQSGLTLRAYQRPIAEAVFDSVINQRGLGIVVILPRQSGKNELQAQLEALILTSFQDVGGEMVKISPTWKPQTVNAMRRLERVLQRSPLAGKRWSRHAGYIFRLGQASLSFLSGSPETNIVGATASLLLSVDEAQDILIEKFDREIAPMAASTNATRVFWGTAWTSQTLLGRELRAARAAEARDGIRRAFVLGAGAVMSEVPAYAAFVEEQVRRLGRRHPLVRTQYFSEEMDGQGGLFPPERLALLRGAHPAEETPAPGAQYVVLVDVGGEEARAGAVPDAQMPLLLDGDSPAPAAGTPATGPPAAGGRRDSSAATVVRLDPPGSPSNGQDGYGPVFRVVQRHLWTGAPHTRLVSDLHDLALHWHAARVVMDATGIGAGLAAFLARALGEGRVQRFLFTAQSKSRLGWDFLTLIETGRFKDHLPPEDAFSPAAILQALFFEQASACTAQVGAGQTLRWGVPESARHPVSRGRLHDDLLVSAALCAALPDLPHGSGESVILPAADPLADLDNAW